MKCDEETVSKLSNGTIFNELESGADLDHITVICMLFCIRLPVPNFIQIGAHIAEI